MLDLKRIRQNFDEVAENLANRGVKAETLDQPQLAQHQWT